MAILPRTEIAPYEYANYQAFKTAFLAELEVQKYQGYNNIAGFNYAQFQDIPQIFEGVDLKQMFAEIDSELRWSMANGGKKAPKYDKLVSQAIADLEHLSKWGQDQQGALVNQAHLNTLINRLGESLTSFNPYKIRNIMMTQMGFIMEDIWAQTMNQHGEQFKKAFSDKHIKKVIEASVNQKKGQYGVRGASVQQLEKFPKIKTKASTNPLVDASLILQEDGATFNVNVSLKSSFMPNAKYIKAFTGSWNSLLVETVNRLCEKNRWGLYRYLYYGKQVEKEIQMRIVGHNIADLISGSGADTADFLVYNGKWYPMSKVVEAVAKNIQYDAGSLVRLQGALKGQGQPYTEEHKLRFKYLQAQGLKLSDRDKAVISWLDQKGISMGFGKIAVAYSKELLDTI